MGKSGKLDPIQNSFRADFSFLILLQAGSGTAEMPFADAWNSHYHPYHNYFSISPLTPMKREITPQVLITRKQKFEIFLSGLQTDAASFSS